MKQLTQRQLDVNEDIDKDDFLKRISGFAEQRGLKIQEGAEVKHVRRLLNRQFEVITEAGKVFPTRMVLVAIGRQGQPRLLECPGADKAHKVTYRLHSPEDYQQKDLLIVGGGNSAIEAALRQTSLPGLASTFCNSVLPVICSVLFVVWLLNTQRELRRLAPLFRLPIAGTPLLLTVVGYVARQVAPTVFTLDVQQAGPGPYYLPGLSWIFRLIPPCFSNLYGFYYLAYFVAITGFGLYWAAKSGHHLI